MLFEAKLGGRSAIISDNEKSCVAKNIQHDIDSGKFNFKDYDQHNGKVTFLDIGACLGMVSMHVIRLRRWTTISIEPHPENYKHMGMNFYDNNEHAVMLPFAVGSLAGFAPMAMNASNTGGATLNSKFCRIKDPHHSQVVVPVIPLNHIVENHFWWDGPLVIKMDIEGSEHEAFDGFKYWDRVVCLHLECHINDNLRTRGFSNEKLISEISSKFKGDFIHSSIEMGE